MKPKKTLLELRTQGFQKLRPDKIHLRCPHCGRKQSNGPRDNDNDPDNAFLIEILCDRCNAGCKEDLNGYFDKDGKMIDYWKWYDKKNDTEYGWDGSEQYEE